jgi:glutathione-regulated potassium-efflux system protein KefB
MISTQLIQVAVFLAAGVVIGPFGIGLIFSLYDVENVLHFAEFGVVMLLFVIGLELRPVRLLAMRSAIFGLGTAQLAVTAIMLAAIGLAIGLTTRQALFVGLALSLSSNRLRAAIAGREGRAQ